MAVSILVISVGNASITAQLDRRGGWNFTRVRIPERAERKSTGTGYSNAMDSPKGDPV